MKKVFSLIMGLSILLSSSSLVSAVNSSYPPKQFLIKTQLTEKPIPHSGVNGISSAIVGQREYGEQDIVLSIWMTGHFWLYWYEKIIRLNSTSVDDGKKFYETFFDDTKLDTLGYDKTWKRVKREVKEALNEKKEQTHASEDLNEVLRQFMESRMGWNIFYLEFTSETAINNIFPGCLDLEEGRGVAMYRINGQVLQFIMHFVNSKMGVNDSHHYFIFESDVRVFPNSHAVRASVIWRYTKGLYKKRIHGRDCFIPRWATIIIKIPLPLPSECVKNYITAIWLVYEKKFNLISWQKSLLLFNKAWDLQNDHPKLYKYEGTEHLLERPENENMWFYIRDPDDKGKNYQSLGLIVLVEIV